MKQLPDLGITQVYLYDTRDVPGLAANMQALRKTGLFVHRANFERALVLGMKNKGGKLGMVVACNYQMNPAALPAYTRIMRLLDEPVYRHNDTHAQMLIYYNNAWFSPGIPAAKLLDERCKTIGDWCDALEAPA